MIMPAVVISGAGALTQNGSGLLVLNGVNAVSGLTSVNSGILEVGDAAHLGAVLDSHIGGVNVNPGGTLEGHGTINGAVHNLGGIVSPGGSIGTLTVGTFSQGAGGTLAIEVAPLASSQLNVLGAASLNGTLALAFDPGVYTAHVYTILTSPAITGAFSALTTTGAPSNLVVGAYNAPGLNQINLIVEPTSGGQGFGATTTASLDGTQSIAGLVTDHQDDGPCAGSAVQLDSANGGMKVAATGGEGKACDGFNVWARALARVSHGGDASHETDGGVLGGFDARLANGASLGMAFAYTDNTLDQSAVATRSDGQTWFISGYGRAAVGRLVLDGQVFYADNRWDQKRTIAGFGVAASHPNGSTIGGVVQVSYPLLGGDVNPYVRLSYARLNQDATTETGAGVGPLALATAATSTDSTRAELGVKFAATLRQQGVTFSPELRVAVSQELGDVTRNVPTRLALIPGTGFTASSVEPSKTAAIVAGGLRAQMNERLDFYGDVHGRFSSNQSEGAFTIGGHYRF